MSPSWSTKSPDPPTAHVKPITVRSTVPARERLADPIQNVTSIHSLTRRDGETAKHHIPETRDIQVQTRHNDKPYLFEVDQYRVPFKADPPWRHRAKHSSRFQTERKYDNNNPTKVFVSLELPKSLINVQDTPRTTTFSPEKIAGPTAPQHGPRQFHESPSRRHAAPLPGYSSSAHRYSVSSLEANALSSTPFDNPNADNRANKTQLARLNMAASYREMDGEGRPVVDRTRRPPVFLQNAAGMSPSLLNPEGALRNFGVREIGNDNVQNYGLPAVPPWSQPPQSSHKSEFYPSVASSATGQLKRYQQLTQQTKPASSSVHEPSTPLNPSQGVPKTVSVELITQKLQQEQIPPPPSQQPKLATIQPSVSRLIGGSSTHSLKISDKIGKQPQMVELPPQEPQRTAPCSLCGRAFALDRIARHERACVENKSTRERRPFDAAYMRKRGTDLERNNARMDVEAEKKLENMRRENKDAWRRQHEELILSLRNAKAVQAHIAKGGRASDIPLPRDDKKSGPPVGSECPHCARRFSDNSYARHVEICGRLAQKNSHKNLRLRPR
ncbi:hypothetical protein HDU83_007650 [Entophlyctis luteolus]|nr:hypothetical protein HDU83_007650 [Entophlyctis luteolus]